jgi:hypothetical protein
MFLLAPPLLAQMPPGDKHSMMPDCAAMMQQHQSMKKHMVEMDAKLAALVNDMNLAKGSARIDRTAAVVTELVAQRAMIQKSMMEMHPKMLEHMQQHMMSGMMKGMAEGMAGCPMMKGGEKAEGKAAAEHKH